ncbi:uncharacterized protein MYCGRDRAFT_92901 [Zymoseptoria tritici IPO323]|uniref:Uncharacterized protein n=1 Tax=Zymoseptoria tritici (strain CBS 115943 / IPO323) TaxID=336722 RepID=F9X9A3_ZYMTI|nr:uncharacterized protein MYCGRDRAFT_92901 [Zymoseptoria tritici IPO323]EGP88181.1 hypothetical protein MYCGRDRAFT_92901 [Zymoseptoria tritici IPO323]
MLVRTSMPLLALMVTSCSAQGERSLDNQIANLVLTEQGADRNVECGQYDGNPSPETIAVSIFDNYTETCHDLATLFSQDQYDNDTITESQGRLSSCDPYFLNCTNDVRADGLNVYSSTTNYSQIQVDIYGYATSYPGMFTLQVFPEERCLESAVEPWFSWGGCDQSETTSDCSELQNGVRSFRLAQTAPEDNGKCLLKAERGPGVQLRGTSVGVVMGGFIVAGVLAVM